MKAESNIKPNKIEIENISKERWDIVITSNIAEIVEDEKVKYSYDIYRINVCYNEDIKNNLEKNYDKYLDIAINRENKKNAIEEIPRLQEQLDNTDYKIIKCSECQLVGLEMPYNIKELHLTRQKLRDRINELQEIIWKRGKNYGNSNNCCD